jgi:hypothetical protein
VVHLVYRSVVIGNDSDPYLKLRWTRESDNQEFKDRSTLSSHHVADSVHGHQIDAFVKAKRLGE